MEIMDIVITCLLRAVAGWLAKLLMGGKRGLIGNIILGIVGGFVGNYVFGLIGFSMPGPTIIASILSAAVGACLGIFAFSLYLNNYSLVI